MKKVFRPKGTSGASVRHWIKGSVSANLLSGATVSGVAAFVDPLDGVLIPGTYVGDFGSITIDGAGAWTYTMIKKPSYSGAFDRIAVPSTSSFRYQGRNGLTFDIMLDPASSLGASSGGGTGGGTGGGGVVTPPVDPVVTPSASLPLQMAMFGAVTPALLAQPFNSAYAFAA